MTQGECLGVRSIRDVEKRRARSRVKLRSRVSARRGSLRVRATSRERQTLWASLRVKGRVQRTWKASPSV